jgi:hypothetical protein
VVWRGPVTRRAARECSAGVGDIDDPGRAGAVGDRQLPENLRSPWFSPHRGYSLLGEWLLDGRSRRSWIRVLFTSMPSATAAAISVSVITPIGRLLCRTPMRLLMDLEMIAPG